MRYEWCVLMDVAWNGFACPEASSVARHEAVMGIVVPLYPPRLALLLVLLPGAPCSFVYTQTRQGDTTATTDNQTSE